MSTSARLQTEQLQKKPSAAKRTPGAEGEDAADIRDGTEGEDVGELEKKDPERAAKLKESLKYTRHGVAEKAGTLNEKANKTG